jgi:MHS family proline/betaine transporter-like MFS transporter
MRIAKGEADMEEAARANTAEGARKAVTSGAIGNVIEWYDFAVYGYFATVIATQFFPSENRVASLLATFAVFAVAFFMLGAAKGRMHEFHI